jgi:hypothetical protein
MKYLNRVTDLTFLGEYRVRLYFLDGYAGEVDLWPLFANPRGPLTEPFQAPGFFQRGFIEGGALAWSNGYDICPDVLRYYCETGKVTSKEEMHAYFSEDRTNAVLHDQPKEKRK